jgi:enoyl-CoA hydratase
MTALVATRRDGHVLVITMQREAKRNAVNRDLADAIDDALNDLDDDGSLWAGVLTGGSSFFCAGSDLTANGDYSTQRGGEYGIIRRVRRKPLIAAVEGPAIAGGTEILQGTDIRVAGESAKFGISEAKWSLYPMGGSAVRLVRQIPYTIACDLLLTGRHITAAEALEYGLIGYVVPDGGALEKALAIAEVINNNGPLAVQAILKSIHDTEGMHELDAFKIDTKIGIDVFLSDDAKEGPLAFKEKRAPNFQMK